MFTPGELVNELRYVCGHDSRSIASCITCEAADLIENLSSKLAAAEERINTRDGKTADRRKRYSWPELDARGDRAFRMCWRPSGIENMLQWLPDRRAT